MRALLADWICDTLYEVLIIGFSISQRMGRRV